MRLLRLLTSWICMYLGAFLFLLGSFVHNAQFMIQGIGMMLIGYIGKDTYET